jgi:hypothetical protein
MRALDSSGPVRLVVIATLPLVLSVWLNFASQPLLDPYQFYPSD